ncbi:unnamed protein product [Scytosiphon promiscuus]
MTGCATLVPTGTKRASVRRLSTCDGPLACHAIQGCIYGYVRAGAAAVSRGDSSRKKELGEWLVAVLETIMDCLDGKARGERTDNKRRRCAVFLLQLLSTILKSERGASHPERSNHPAKEEPAEPPAVSIEAVLAPKAEVCSGWETVAAQACARTSKPYLEKMVREASRLSTVLGDHNGDAGSIGFWVLSLLADVLKGLGKGKRGWGDVCVRPRCKRNHLGETREVMVASSSLPSVTTVVETDSIADDDVGDSRDRSTSERLDVTGVAEAVAAFPVEGGAGATDAALKWLEVIQLLMETAGKRCESLLADIFNSVPPTLWKIASRTGLPSLLPQEARPRPPGAAFVEVGGAGGALAQAMLTVVFRMVRVGGARGFRRVPERADAEPTERNGASMEGRREDVDGHGRISPIARPWRTAAEAIVTTATSGVDVEGSSLGLAGRLVRLFSDQDDALVDMLLTNLHIFHDTRVRLDAIGENDGSAFPPSLEILYSGVFHPGALFAALLSEVRFDSGVLLDWLISPETSFLRYLTMLLRFAVAEWPHFAARVSCAKVVTLQTGAQIASFVKHVEGGQGEEEEKEEEEEELVLSEEEADRLGKSVSCLNGLVTSARALEKSGLVPYNLAPLLRRIDQVVSLYEDCGDADDAELG